MSGGIQREGATGSSYRRICGIASGGMGIVELAIREEGRFRRLYAVKRLRDVYRDEPEFREMFLEEARIAGLIRHPNVVSVLDVGEDDAGPFLVMDYVEGASVAQMLKRSSAAGEEVPMQVALRIVMDTAKGLHAAHELRDASGRRMGLVHRDVSPQNLLVGFDGLTRVTDFGIAKAWGRTTRTATGVLKGKFGYLSPEQLRFEEPDRRSDLFSLGVVLHELLSGERLYRNKEGMDGARRILKEPPPDLGEVRDDVPAELIALSFSMLAKEVEHRPPDALFVARTLETIVADLVSIEGRVDVAEFVSEAFAEERRAQKERVAAAIASTAGEPRSPKTDPAEASARGPAPASALRILPLIAVAGVIGVAAAVGVILASGLLSGDPARETPGEAPEPSSRRPVVEVIESVERMEDRPLLSSDPTVEEEEHDANDTAATPVMTMRRVRRGMSRPRTMSSMGGGVPMWDWQ